MLCNFIFLPTFANSPYTKVRFVKKKKSESVVVTKITPSQSSSSSHDEKEPTNLFVMNEFNMVAWSYLLIIFSPVLAGVGVIVGLIMAFVLKSNTEDELLKSHLKSIIKVMVISIVLSIISIPLVFLGIGLIMLIGIGIYVYYKMIRGFMLLIKRKPI